MENFWKNCSVGSFARSEMNPQEEVADKIPELTEQEDIPAQAEETASNGKKRKKEKNKKKIRKRKKRKKAASGRTFPDYFRKKRSDEEEKQPVHIGNSRGRECGELSEENRPDTKGT